MRLASRRSFLKGLLAVLPAWPVLRPLAAALAGENPVPRPIPGPMLTAVAEAVLPSTELGADGVADAVLGFELWWTGFEPDAELDHPYLWSDELRYGPADPRPLWESQLEALESASLRRDGKSFAELEVPERQRLIQVHLPEIVPERIPHASEAPHVSLALAAWFVSTSSANDLCYGAAIGRHECRGLPSVVDEPAAIAARRAPGWSQRRGPQRTESQETGTQRSGERA